MGFSSIYLLPQLLKTYKSKKVRDLSKIFLWYNFSVHLAWTLYNIYRIMNDSSILPYIINSGIRTITAGVLLIMFYKYGGEKNECWNNKRNNK